MEINRFEDVLGVVTTEDITEGRFVILTSHSYDHDFGSWTDLPGCKLPDNTEEAKRAKYILTWQVDNRQPPYYTPQPALSYSLRVGGFDQAANVPFDANVRMTYPGYQNCQVIPSGTTALAFTEGTFTVMSGCYVDSAEIKIPGAAIIIANTGDDSAGEAGMPKYTATFAAGVIGVTERYDSATGALTIRVE